METKLLTPSCHTVRVNAIALILVVLHQFRALCDSARRRRRSSSARRRRTRAAGNRRGEVEVEVAPLDHARDGANDDAGNVRLPRRRLESGAKSHIM